MRLAELIIDGVVVYVAVQAIKVYGEIKYNEGVKDGKAIERKEIIR